MSVRRLFGAHRTLALALALLFAVALFVRLPGLTDPALDFHSTRQYRSFLLSRHIRLFLEQAKPAERAVDRAMAREQGQLIEPPILEAVVAGLDRLFGTESPWIPRGLSVCFWLAGGWFLVSMARRFLPGLAVIVCGVVYLLLPYGVEASRSFQPDPLMVMLMLGGLWAITRYHCEPSRRHLVVAGALSGAAVLVKPMSAFALLAGFASLGVFTAQGRRLRAAATFLPLALVPALAYYVTNVVLGPSLREGIFFPELLRTKSFWAQWVSMTGVVVGYVPVGLSLVALATHRSGPLRRVLGSMLAGYVCLGLVWNYHIHTHDYYSLQLIPAVALGTGMALDQVVRWVRTARIFSLVAALVFLVSGLVTVIAQLHPTPLRAAEESRARQMGNLLSPQWRAEQGRAFRAYADDYREIGNLVGHSARTLFVAQAYGKPLAFHGKIAGSGWPTAADIALQRLKGDQVKSTQQLFDDVRRAREPEWFIITDFSEFAAQTELQAVLASYPLAHRAPRYLIYDLRRPAPGSTAGPSRR